MRGYKFSRSNALKKAGQGLEPARSLYEARERNVQAAWAPLSTDF